MKIKPAPWMTVGIVVMIFGFGLLAINIYMMISVIVPKRVALYSNMVIFILWAWMQINSVTVLKRKQKQWD